MGKNTEHRFAFIQARASAKCPCKAFHANPANDTVESAMHEAVCHNADVIITQARHAVRDTR